MEFYHNTMTTQVNALKSRSYYIPFTEEKFSLDKRESKQVVMLDKWRFAYFPRFTPEAESCVPEEEFTLPFCWQLKGFDYNQYANFFYPIPYTPPTVMRDNPCGVYQTEYAVEKEGERHYLVFEGVDSCLYLFVNGKQVGYSTVSHSTAEFDITEYLHCGNNTLRVIVFKWCSGTYVEDQDKLRLSGIFRDVYVLKRPNGHLTDYKIVGDSLDFQNGTISFTCDKPAKVTVYDGDTLLAEENGTDWILKIKNVKLWSAETPYLYRLVIAYQGEYIEEYVGIRHIHIENSVFKLNGKPIKFKGVNRHSMTENGYVEDLDVMKKDLAMFKQYNINAVRTSHYPPHPVFTRLCDRMGIYVIEEADLETHGVQTTQYNGNLSRFDEISDNPLWEDVYVHRQERMYERDKNCPSVIMWSMGNEAGWGCNFRKCSDYLRSVDARPIHYESNTKHLQPEAGWRDMEYVDVASRMYPPVEKCKSLIDGEIGQPFILCEYTHAMGNSCGDVKGYWDYIYAEERFCGAFVWEWCNHSIKTAEGFIFGGDFNEPEPISPLEGNFCVDGLVNTDRTPHPSLSEIKEVYAPVDVQASGEGEYTIINRYDFLSLDALTCRVEEKRNGQKVKEQSLDIRNIPARGKKTFKIAVQKDGYTTLDFLFENNEGELVAKRQAIVSTQYPLSEKGEGEVRICTRGENVCIQTPKYTAYVNHRGLLSSLEKEGEWLGSPMEFCLTRNYIDNDLPFVADWQRMQLKESFAYPDSIDVQKDKVVVKGKIVANIIEPLYEYTLTYIPTPNFLTISVQAKKMEWVTHVPRFGLKFSLAKRFDKVEYFGRGEGEAYVDRLASCPVGLYEKKREDMNFIYQKPQDSGSRCGCRMVKLKGKQTICVESGQDFAFTATPYDVDDYPRHDYQMKDMGKNLLFVDYKMAGVGSGACGDPLYEKYRVTDEDISLEFSIILNR